jgi:preprotein translocase SecE subunit
MAVAVKTSPEAPARNPVQQLAVRSWLGALYLLFSLGLVFGQLPILWDQLGIGNRFLSDALLMIVTVVVIVGLILLGRQLEGSHPPRGARAGAVLGAVGLFLALYIGLGLGNTQGEEMLGLGIAVVVGGGLAALLGWLSLMPGVSARLVNQEAQGWFHAIAYKASQGVRVRRGSFVGELALVGFGIYTMILHRTAGTGNWALDVPGTNYALYLLFNVQLTLPVVLLLLGIWVSWRVVNWPVFADFLIATEAEMNKVSWTTRKRLVQDTVVVLVTVALLAVFLFVVDVMWIRILSNPVVHVLQVDLKEEQMKQRQPTEW